MSDEQQSALLQEQLGHPEFPQLQPIANTHVKIIKKDNVFFIIKFSLSYIILHPQTRLGQKKRGAVTHHAVLGYILRFFNYSFSSKGA